MTAPAEERSREADVVVLGTGAAGLVAALVARSGGATVEIHDKALTLGGTTAMSGGIVWVPVHDRVEGRELSVDAAIEYLRAHTRGSLDEALMRAHVQVGGDVLDFLEDRTGLDFQPLPDYLDDEPQLPGGCAGGRSFLASLRRPARVDGFEDLFTDLPGDFEGIGFDPRTGSKVGGRGGATLVAGLLDALLGLGVRPHLGSRGLELAEQDGGVVGVRVASPDGGVTMIRCRAVILATGGFEWDVSLRDAFVRGPVHGSTSAPSSTGDGLRMARAAGSGLAGMTEAWWSPYFLRPDATGESHEWGFILERSRPGSIMVNRFGRRFVNEAVSFNAIGGPFQVQRPEGYVNDPAWVVFDSRHLAAYGAFGVAPGGEAPHWFHPSADLESLGRAAGIDAEALVDTVTSWNGDVAEGMDSEFGRGATLASAWSGDDGAASPAARTLGPLDQPPFYAVRVYMGVFGTKGGPPVDEAGRILDVVGRPIRGLLGAGAAVASCFGTGYGGPGAPLGLALTGGYRAGQTALQSPDWPVEIRSDS